jgi:hypothetical protein
MAKGFKFSDLFIASCLIVIDCFVVIPIMLSGSLLAWRLLVMLFGLILLLVIVLTLLYLSGYWNGFKIHHNEEIHIG